MLNPQPTLVEHLVCPSLRQRSLLTAWLLGRHENLDLRKREGQEAQILQQPTPGGQGIGGRVGNSLIMDSASTSVTEKEDREGRMDEQDIFHRMVLFLAAITPRLFNSVLGADGSCPSSLRLIPTICKPSKMPSFLHLYEGVLLWSPISFSPRWC